MPESQPSFEYDDATLAICEKFVSSERLAAYVQYARGDKWVAIRLYERNTEVSEALYGVVQALEVTLRNAIHNTLSEKLRTAEWFDTFTLEDSERNAVEAAKSKVAERALTVTPGRVVAELGFAFWVRLFSHSYDKTLWVPYLRRIFPVKLDGSRTLVHGRLVELKTLRNRIAHHERITCGHRDIRRNYLELLETIGWINSKIRQWVESINCFEERFAKPLPKKPKPEPAPKPEVPLEAKVVAAEV
jgi:hypothetical protein